MSYIIYFDYAGKRTYVTGIRRNDNNAYSWDYTNEHSKADAVRDPNAFSQIHQYLRVYSRVQAHAEPVFEVCVN